MVVKLFVLGHPGSGKSSICQYIVTYVNQQYKNWSAEHLSDYGILYEMYQADTGHKRFHRASRNSFIVQDHSVYNVALMELEKKVGDKADTSNILGDKFISIEFARDSYYEALKQFSSEFISGAYFLFLDVDIPTCIKRVRQRAVHPNSLDDHFVSREVFKSYRKKDSKAYISTGLQRDYGITDYQIRIFENKGSFQEIAGKTEEFINFILQKCVNLVSSTSELNRQPES